MLVGRGQDFDHQATDRDVGRYDSRDGEGRVAPGAAIELSRRWKCTGLSGHSSTAVPDAVLTPLSIESSASDLQGWPLSHVLDRCSRRGSTSSIHGVVCFAAPARLGNCSHNCSCVVLTSSIPAGRLRCSRLLLLAQLYLLLPWSRTFRHLTARNGGNAQGL